VITEPMMVFGAGKYREQFREYFGMVLWMHWGISTIIALGLGIAVFFFGSLSTAQLLIVLAIVSPLLLLIWLARRACYAQFRPALAVAGEVINLSSIFVGLIFLLESRILTFASALLLMGIASSAASLFIVLQLRPLVKGDIGNPTASQVLLEHWQYGRWNFLYALVSWLSGQIVVLISSFFYGLRASATIAASWNLYAPLNLFVQGVSLLVLPTLANFRERRQFVFWKRLTFAFSFSFGGLVLTYVAFLALFAKKLMKLLYSDSYSNTDILILIGIHFVFTTAGGMLAYSLKSSLKVTDVVKIRVVAGFLFLIFAFPLGYFLGISGLILSMIIGEAFLTIFLFREVNNS
jgi:O-antigen/teichoic acid export membrane protein